MGKTFSTGLLTNGVFQDTSNNIGIGAAPSGTYKLEVTGTAKVSSTLLVSGASTLTGASIINAGSSGTITLTTNGSANNWTSAITGSSTTSQSYGLLIQAGTNSTDAALRIRNQANTLDWLFVRGDGNVGIGTTAPDYQFQVNANTTNFAAMVKNTSTTFGNGLYLYSPNNSSSSTNEGFLRAENSAGIKAYIYTNGSYGSATGTYGALASDLRLKENVVEASSKLDDLLKLRVVNFNLIEDLDKRKQIGFIAQEFKEIFPSLVYERDTREYDEEGNIKKGLEDSMGLSVGMEFAILVKAIQEQQAMITSLQDRLDKAGL